MIITRSQQRSNIRELQSNAKRMMKAKAHMQATYIYTYKGDGMTPSMIELLKRLPSFAHLHRQ